MKTILIAISESYSQSDLQRLCEAAEREKIAVVFGKDATVETDVLVITDDKEMVALAKEKGYACVGYDCEENGVPFYEADVVVQGLAGVDIPFLKQVYERQKGIPWTIAKTDRLLIRESDAADFTGIYSLYQESGMADFMEGMSGAAEMERYLFMQYIKHHYPFYGYGMWSIIEQETGRLIGRAGLENKEYHGEDVVAIGYMIGTEYQRKGYAAEAVQAICSYAFLELEISQLFAFINSENERSIKLIGKMGFRKIGVEKEGQNAYNLNRRKEVPDEEYKDDLLCK